MIIIVIVTSNVMTIVVVVVVRRMLSVDVTEHCVLHQATRTTRSRSDE